MLTDQAWESSACPGRCSSPAPRTGTESHAATDSALDGYLHLYLSNRDVLITPCHMALMCPQTTAADIGVHEQVFTPAVAELCAT